MNSKETVFSMPYSKGIDPLGHEWMQRQIQEHVRPVLLEQRQITEQTSAAMLVSVLQQLRGCMRTQRDVARRVPARYLQGDDPEALRVVLRAYLQFLNSTGLEFGFAVESAALAEPASRLMAQIGEALRQAGLWVLPMPVHLGPGFSAPFRTLLQAALRELGGSEAVREEGARVVVSADDQCYVAVERALQGHWPAREVQRGQGLVWVHALGRPDDDDSWVSEMSVRQWDESEGEGSVRSHLEDDEAPIRVSSRWLQDCHRERCWLSPDDYRLHSTVGASLPGVVLRSRTHGTALAEFLAWRQQDETFQLPEPAALPAWRVGSSDRQASPSLLPSLLQTPVEQWDQLLPAHPAATWFRADRVHELERHALPEFFDGKRADRNEATYMGYRRFMMAAYAANPATYLTMTAVRRNLAGDAGAIMRVHAFLTHWRLINGHCPSLAPSKWAFHPPSVSTTNRTTATPSPTGPSSSSSSTLAEVHAALEVQNGAAKVSSLLRQSPFPPPREPGADERGASVRCQLCQNDTSAVYYRNLAADPAVEVCPKCIVSSGLPRRYAPSDFEKVVALGSVAVANPWKEEETLRLVEALHRHGDSWDRVASYVGTRSKRECVLHFVQLPIEEPFLHSHLLGAKRPRSAADSAGRSVPYLPSSNPVASLIDYLASSVDPEVAKAAAQAALRALPSVPQEDIGADSPPPLHSEMLPDSSVHSAAAAAVGVAALRARVFESGVEREMSRVLVDAVRRQLAVLSDKMTHLNDLDDALTLQLRKFPSLQNPPSTQ